LFHIKIQYPKIGSHTEQSRNKSQTVFDFTQTDK